MKSDPPAAGCAVRNTGGVSMSATAATLTMATEVEPAINELPTPTPRPQPFSPLRGEKRAMSDGDNAPSPVSDGPGTRAAGGGLGVREHALGGGWRTGQTL